MPRFSPFPTLLALRCLDSETRNTHRRRASTHQCTERRFNAATLRREDSLPTPESVTGSAAACTGVGTAKRRSFNASRSSAQRGRSSKDSTTAVSAPCREASCTSSERRSGFVARAASSDSGRVSTNKFKRSSLAPSRRWRRRKRLASERRKSCSSASSSVSAASASPALSSSASPPPAPSSKTEELSPPTPQPNDASSAETSIAARRPAQSGCRGKEGSFRRRPLHSCRHVGALNCAARLLAGLTAPRPLRVVVNSHGNKLTPEEFPLRFHWRLDSQRCLFDRRSEEANRQRRLFLPSHVELK